MSTNILSDDEFQMGDIVYNKSHIGRIIRVAYYNLNKLPDKTEDEKKCLEICKELLFGPENLYYK